MCVISLHEYWKKNQQVLFSTKITLLMSSLPLFYFNDEYPYHSSSGAFILFTRARESIEPIETRKFFRFNVNAVNSINSNERTNELSLPYIHTTHDSMTLVYILYSSCETERIHFQSHLHICYMWACKRSLVRASAYFTLALQTPHRAAYVLRLNNISAYQRLRQPKKPWSNSNPILNATDEKSPTNLFINMWENDGTHLQHCHIS